MTEQAQQKAQQDNVQDAAEISAVLAVLLSGPPLVTAVQALSAVLKKPGKLVLAALAGMKYKPGKKGIIAGDDPVSAARRTNLRYRAAYLVAAVQRLAAADDLPTALKREKALFTAHMQACARRIEAAKATAREAQQAGGDLLGWDGILDSRTTPDCRYLIGKNFLASDPPDGLFPGGRHPKCRCYPVPPFPGKPVVTTAA